MITMNEPLVSIVIPTYNRKKMAGRAVRSLLKNTYKNIEIIVIDDASLDNTTDYLNKQFKKNIKVLIYKNKKNLYAAGAKNVGQEKIHGKYLQFFDDDNVADKNMIEQLVNVLENNPDVGEVGPVNYNFRNKKLLISKSTRSMLTTKTYHLRSLAPFKGMSKWLTDDIPNSFMVRAGVVRNNKIKFKSELGIMYEESDYAYRIKKLGYKIVFVKKAKIFHDIDDFSGSHKKDYRYHFMSDNRRPFVFARNRLIFHSLYSNRIQMISILSIWVWVFTIYYAFSFLFYSGFGNFSLSQRISAAAAYVRGTLNGLYIIMFGKMSSFK